MRIFSKIFLVASFMLSQIVLADNFVQIGSTKRVAITPLTPFDEAFKQEMQKYPKDSAFFIDGRTGKIISVNKLPKIPKSTGVSQNYSTKAPTKTHSAKPKSPSKSKAIPYQMQEERVEILQ